jgi:hypothetical protein
MEHVRFNVLTTDPAALNDAIRYIDDEARPLVEREPGSRGLSVSADCDLGVAVITSFWVSGDAMRESEKAAAAIREEALRRGIATVSVEHFEVASTLRVSSPTRAAGVRVTRSDVDPQRIDDAITAYEDTALPPLTEADGLCSALMFVHRRTGRAVAETVWRDTDALAASRGIEAIIRVDAVAATDAAIRALDEYRVVFTAGRLD